MTSFFRTNMWIEWNTNVDSFFRICNLNCVRFLERVFQFKQCWTLRSLLCRIELMFEIHANWSRRSCSIISCKIDAEDVKRSFLKAQFWAMRWRRNEKIFAEIVRHFSNWFDRRTTTSIKIAFREDSRHNHVDHSQLARNDRQMNTNEALQIRVKKRNISEKKKFRESAKNDRQEWFTMSLNQRKWIQSHKWLRTLYEMLSTKWTTLKLKRLSQLLICCLMWVEIRARNHRQKYAKLTIERTRSSTKKMSDAKMKKMWRTTWKWERENDDIYIEKKRRAIVSTNLARSRKRQTQLRRHFDSNNRNYSFIDVQTYENECFYYYFWRS